MSVFMTTNKIGIQRTTVIKAIWLAVGIYAVTLSGAVTATGFLAPAAELAVSNPAFVNLPQRSNISKKAAYGIAPVQVAQFE